MGLLMSAKRGPFPDGMPPSSSPLHLQKEVAPTASAEVGAKVTITREADEHGAPITTQIDARLSWTRPPQKRTPPKAIGRGQGSGCHREEINTGSQESYPSNRARSPSVPEY
jgi:hypothetical protein